MPPKNFAEVQKWWEQYLQNIFYGAPGVFEHSAEGSHSSILVHCSAYTHGYVGDVNCEWFLNAEFPLLSFDTRDRLREELLVLPVIGKLQPRDLHHPQVEFTVGTKGKDLWWISGRVSGEKPTFAASLSGNWTLRLERPTYHQVAEAEALR